MAQKSKPNLPSFDVFKNELQPPSYHILKLVSVVEVSSLRSHSKTSNSRSTTFALGCIRNGVLFSSSYFCSPQIISIQFNSK